jgi:hypothetical protein
MKKHNCLDCATPEEWDNASKTIRLRKGKHYNCTSGYWSDGELHEVVKEVVYVGKEDGSLWVMDKDGDEFEALKEDLEEII